MCTCAYVYGKCSLPSPSSHKCLFPRKRRELIWWQRIIRIFPSISNVKYFLCTYSCILYICPQFWLLNRKDQIFKGIIHTVEYFEVTYENSSHLPPLSLSIYTDLGGVQRGIFIILFCAYLHFNAIKTLKISPRGIDTRRMFCFINGYLVFLKASFIFGTHLGQPWDKLSRIT